MKTNTKTQTKYIIKDSRPDVGYPYVQVRDTAGFRYTSSLSEAKLYATITEAIQDIRERDHIFAKMSYGLDLSFATSGLHARRWRERGSWWSHASWRGSFDIVPVIVEEITTRTVKLA